jgi:hypothetical protein
LRDKEETSDARTAPLRALPDTQGARGEVKQPEILASGGYQRTQKRGRAPAFPLSAIVGAPASFEKRWAFSADGKGHVILDQLVSAMNGPIIEFFREPTSNEPLPTPLKRVVRRPGNRRQNASKF